MNMNQKTFDGHVERYVQALNQLKKARAAQQQQLNAQPKRPVSATLEDTNSYATAMQDWKDERGRLKAVKDENYQQVQLAQANLLDAIPASRVWIRSGDSAVGAYRDAWGGMSWEIAVRPWSDDLPELKDRTYYP